jgi:hypothetical protein
MEIVPLNRLSFNYPPDFQAPFRFYRNLHSRKQFHFVRRRFGGALLMVLVQRTPTIGGWRIVMIHTSVLTARIWFKCQRANCQISHSLCLAQSFAFLSRPQITIFSGWIILVERAFHPFTIKGKCFPLGVFSQSPKTASWCWWRKTLREFSMESRIFLTCDYQVLGTRRWLNTKDEMFLCFGGCFGVRWLTC